MAADGRWEQGGRRVKRFLLGVGGRFNWLRLRLLRSLYSGLVVLRVGSHGRGLRVNGPSRVTRSTHLGSNVNLNGLRVFGLGSVTIGDNFHSGIECVILTDIHNYDEGDAIPYDATIVLKPVVIEDNVWIGSRVTILGGVRLGEGCIVQAGLSSYPTFHTVPWREATRLGCSSTATSRTTSVSSGREGFIEDHAGVFRRARQQARRR